MQIPILNGIFTDQSGDFRTSYPINFIPVPKKQGISNGYLRPAEGIDLVGTASGICRGSINWKGVLYAVMGSKLVSISETGTITEIGDVGHGGTVSLTYSFTHLSVSSNKNLFLYDGTTLTQHSDGDLGDVLDVIWIDGYFMTTDGTSLVVTELNDPFAVNPLKYGSSEVNPDNITSILKLNNEAYALNRYTIEVFDNVGGDGFPFRRIESAMLDKGCVGVEANAVFMSMIAFLGGSENEPCSVWLTSNGADQKIATREVDTILRTYTEEQLALAEFEVKSDKAHEHLLIHLPDHTLVYDATASSEVGEPVWFVLSSGKISVGQYRANHCCWVYNKWFVFDTNLGNFGTLTNNHSHHWGNTVYWEFGTDILFNEANGAIIYELELVCLTGRVSHGKDPTISTQYSLDGVEWSMPRFIKAGKRGDRLKRLLWLDQGHMDNWRSQKFWGNSDAFISPVRLEATIEALEH